MKGVITVWFDANLSSVLGAILDKIKQDGLNSIKLVSVMPKIQKILQKNGFLSFYGYDKVFDTYHTTIEYKKLKPSDSRYFNKYLEDELLTRTEFPNMSDVVHENFIHKTAEAWMGC